MNMGLGSNSNSNENFSIISAGVEINGIINSKGNVRIDGVIKGDVISERNVVIGESGRIEGTLNARNIKLEGKLHGKVTSSEQLTLESTAALDGEITASSLVIKEGAKFEGSCTMTKQGQQDNSNGRGNGQQKQNSGKEKLSAFAAAKN